MTAAPRAAGRAQRPVLTYKGIPVITELEFKSLSAQGYNRIPLMLEAFADLETPLSLYLKLAHAKDGGKHSFLLESVVGGERFGRYGRYVDGTLARPAGPLMRVITTALPAVAMLPYEHALMRPVATTRACD